MVLVGDDDYFDILDELQDVQAQCFKIGIRLKLMPSTLDVIRKEKLDHAESLEKIIDTWLIKKNYNTQKFGEPSWRALVKAVADPLGGDHKALAAKIATKHQSS